MRLPSSACTCKYVLKSTRIHLVVVSGVKTKPHHLQVLNEVSFRGIDPWKYRKKYNTDIVQRF